MSQRQDIYRDGDDRPRFASGDQDYDSAVGWDPRKSSKEWIAESKKRDPRAWAKVPELLDLHPAGDWLEMSRHYDPAGQLFGPFWRRGEVTILFGGTGTGKSALAAQIGESIARGVPTAPFNGEDSVAIEPQPVIYIDFELRANQFAMRYARTGEDGVRCGPFYEFSRNLIRSELKWNGEVTNGYDGFSDMLFTSLINAIHDLDARAVIIDNITFLDRASTSNSNTALFIMRALQQLKRDEDVSVLVLAHTPKRAEWSPVTELDLQGSINLANFADSVFAVARSRVAPELRYLKQVKARSGTLEYDATRVPLFALEKYDLHSAMRSGPPFAADSRDEETRNFLGFRFVEFAVEEEHLEQDARGSATASRSLMRRRSAIREARKLAAGGKSNRAIAVELAIPRSTVQRYLRNA
jgi:KaiC/GvpD/RAD55 family RecA-like ATPase